MRKTVYTMMAIILLLALAVPAMTVAPALAAGTTYYVDASVGASGDGSSGSPWKTITEAAATVTAGVPGNPNNISVAAGTYDNALGENFPIVFGNADVSLVSASGAATTTIYGDAVQNSAILAIVADGITIQGFTFDNCDAAIGATVGGFTVLDNVFSNDPDYNVEIGVVAEVDDADVSGPGTRNSSFSFDDILVDNNTFFVDEYGVLIHIDLEYDDTTTGLSVDFGDMDFTNNTFNLADAASSDGTLGASGVDIDLGVEYLNGGSITVGDIYAYMNTFNSGEDGFDFEDGDFDYLTDTTVTVGDVIVDHNTHNNQEDESIDIDYYDAGYWFGTTTGTYGNLEITNNTVSSSVGNDGIAVDDYGDWSDFSDSASLTAGNVTISNNTIDVARDGIYYNFYELGYDIEHSSQIQTGDVRIEDNSQITADRVGIKLYYDYLGYEMYNDSSVTVGDFHIRRNVVDAGEECIYHYLAQVGDLMSDNASFSMGSLYIVDNDFQAVEEVLYSYWEDGIAYDMYDNTTFAMGDIYIQDNDDIAGDSDGLWIEYYDYYVGSYMYNDSYAELPGYIISGNTFNVAGDSIYFDTYSNPDDNYDNAEVHYGGWDIDDNIFNGGDDGVYFYIEDFCEECYDTTVTTFGDVNITDNEFYSLGGNAVFLEYDEIPYDIDSGASLTFGETNITGNHVDGADYAIKLDFTDVDPSIFGTFTIDDNELLNLANDGILFWSRGGQPIDAFITNNTITSAEYNGMDLAELNGAEVTGNTISDCPRDGIDLWESLNNIVSENTIENTDTGINIRSNSIDNQITCNDILGSTDQGVYIDSSSTGNVINNNNITGGTDNGGVTSVAPVNAENNWWGASDGPSGVGPGSGDGVTVNVDYDPWLTEPSDCAPNAPQWDKSSLSFTSGCSGDCEEITATVCNGQDSEAMEGTSTWELYWIATGNPKDGVVIDSGTINALAPGACQVITYDPNNNPNGATGDYMFKAYQRPLHPGQGVLWSGECEIQCETGTLEVTKTVDWNGVTPDTNQTFEICISGPSYPNGDEAGACQTADYDGEVLFWNDLVPGDYTVTETDPGSGWTVNISNSPATVVAGQAAMASVTNTYETGTIIVNKTTSPVGGVGFGFTDDIAPPNSFSLDDGQTETFLNVVAGTYTVTEDDPSPLYTLNGLSIVDPDGGSSVDLGTRTMTIDLDPGETIECTFLNGSQTGDITAHKFNDLNGNGILDAGEPGLSGWTMTLYAGSSCDPAQELASGATDSNGNVSFTNMSAGNYSVSETLQAGWQNTTNLCQNVTLAAEGSETVNFGNQELPPQPGSITIVKDANPEDDTSFEFAGDLGFFTLTDPSSNSQTFGTLQAGDYDVVESLPENWYLTGCGCTGGDSSLISDGVTIHLDPGEDIICTFTNHQQLPALEADLNVIKSDAFDPVMVGYDVTYTVTVINNGPDTAENVVLTDTLPAGVTYVSAIPSQGTCGEAGGVVTGNLGNIASGASVHVVIIVITISDGVITNNAYATSDTPDPDTGNNSASEDTTVDPCVGSITVVKDINIGAVADGAFCFNTGSLGSFSLPYGGGNYTMTWTDLDPGNYTVTESTPPEGWTLMSVVCSGGDCTSVTDGVTVNLDRGEDITVTFTNEYDEGGTPPIPEMPTILLMSFGLVALGGYVYLRRQRQGIAAA